MVGVEPEATVSATQVIISLSRAVLFVEVHEDGHAGGQDLGRKVGRRYVIHKRKSRIGRSGGSGKRKECDKDVTERLRGNHEGHERHERRGVGVPRPIHSRENTQKAQKPDGSAMHSGGSLRLVEHCGT